MFSKKKNRFLSATTLERKISIMWTSKISQPPLTLVNPAMNSKAAMIPTMLRLTNSNLYFCINIFYLFQFKSIPGLKCIFVFTAAYLIFIRSYQRCIWTQVVTCFCKFFKRIHIKKWINAFFNYRFCLFIKIFTSTVEKISTF